MDTWPGARAALSESKRVGWKFMSMQVAFLHRYLSPFLAGVCMAGATVTSELTFAVALFLAGAGFAFGSLPAGGRALSRLVGSSD